MSLIETLRSRFSSAARKPGASLVLVDAASLSGRGGGREASPRNQLDLLQTLGRYAALQKIRLHAVLDGAPLRQAPDGQVYRDIITVHYTEGRGSREACVAALCRSLGRQAAVLVISADQDMQQTALQQRAEFMSAATLRKAINALGGGEDLNPNRPQRRGRRGRSSGRGTPQENRPPREPAPRKPSGEPPSGEPPPGKKDISAVLDLVE